MSDDLIEDVRLVPCLDNDDASSVFSFPQILIMPPGVVSSLGSCFGTYSGDRKVIMCHTDFYAVSFVFLVSKNTNHNLMVCLLKQT
jgi:hypothetical protein